MSHAAHGSEASLVSKQSGPGRTAIGGDAHRTKLLLLGLRRSGKTSIQKVVFHRMVPKDALFLESTLRTIRTDIDSFVDLQVWDLPGQSSLDSLNLPFADVGAVIFVVDVQDDYVDALAKLVDGVAKAHSINPDINFHVFIHKVDGLSDDYKYDAQRDVEQRVASEMADRNMDPSIHLSYDLTSVYDSSIFIAVSRAIQKLIPQMSTLENLLNTLCTHSKLDKAFLFDVSSRIYVASDASPFDAATYEVCHEYVDFLLEFSELYKNLRPNSPSMSLPSTSAPQVTDISSTRSDGTTDDGGAAKEGGRYADSVARLTPDTTLGFWQVNKHLALVALLRTDTYDRQAGLVDYNVTFFRKAVQEMFALEKGKGTREGVDVDGW